MTATFQEQYDKLNDPQKEAVDAIEGPVMVIAGPGSGKTQVIALRIANILKRTQINPSNILCLTFTESAAINMKKRLNKIIGHSAYFVPIYTFHSFCSQIIKDYPDKFIDLRYSSSEENGQWNFTELEALSDLERYEIFEKILNEGNYKNLRPIKNPYFYIYSISKAISDLKRESLSIENFDEILKREAVELELLLKNNPKMTVSSAKYIEASKKLEKNLELLEIYKLYQIELGIRNRFDFEDMILFVIKSMESDKELLMFLQERFQYVLVDEYQDTNNSQNKLIRLIMSYFESPNLFVVGDDDQSIFRFQGANLENFLYFNNLYKDTKKIVLAKNYRSSKKIVDCAKMLISNNQNRATNILNIDKNLEAEGMHKLDNINPKIVEASSDLIEKFFIASEIHKLKLSGVNLSEIAVICRKNSDIEDMENFFEKFEIPYELNAGVDILKDINIRKLVKLLRLISDLESDNFLFFEVLHFDFLALPLLEVFEVISNDLSELKTLIELVKEDKSKVQEQLFAVNEEGESFIELKEKDKFTDIKIFLKKLLIWEKQSHNISLAHFCEALIKESGFLEHVLHEENSVENLIKLNSFFDFVKQIDRMHQNCDLKKFIDTLDRMQRHKLSITEKTFFEKSDAVKLMTAHKAKGLEFEYVFIYKCTDDNFGERKMRELISLPAFSMQNDTGAILDTTNETLNQTEDERRLFYVAITRAKKGLYLTYANKYLKNGNERDCIKAMFLEEIKDCLETVDLTEIEAKGAEILKSNLEEISTDIFKKDIEDYARHKIENFTLSVTALNTYLNCPRKFFYNNVLKIPRAKPEYMSFGTAIHKALEIFFTEYRNSKSIPAKSLLTEEFKKAINKEVMPSDSKKLWEKKGEEVLDKYFENYKNEFKFPIFLEKFLKTYIDDIAISGKIDKIEYIDEMKKFIKVVDYKTGNVHSRNDIEGKTASSTGDLKRQMLFYKILTDASPGFLFNTVECEFDFLEPKDGKFRKEAFEIQKEDTDELRLLIIETMKKIRNLEFDKTEDISKCQNCEFKNICGR